jgi:hypothetical protein
MSRLPRVTVALLMAVVAVVALILGMVHRREMEHESKRRAHEAWVREMQARSWTNLHPRNWGIIHEATTPGPSSIPLAPGGDLFLIMGQPPYASGRSYRDLGSLDRERARDIIQRMAAFHRAMAEKWRRASQFPGTPVEPDPPPPVNIDGGTVLIF